LFGKACGYTEIAEWLGWNTSSYWGIQWVVGRFGDLSELWYYQSATELLFVKKSLDG